MEGSKEHWKEFASRERIQANSFLQAATKTGVKQTIYLDGLVNDSLELSPHMKSRKEVDEILSSGSIPVTELRASLIIEAQVDSQMRFEIALKIVQAKIEHSLNLLE